MTAMTSKDVVTGIHLDADKTGVVVTADGKLFHRETADTGFDTVHFHTQPLYGVVRRGQPKLLLERTPFCLWQMWDMDANGRGFWALVIKVLSPYSAP